MGLKNEYVSRKAAAPATSQSKGRRLVWCFLLLLACVHYYWPCNHSNMALEAEPSVSWDSISLKLKGERIFLWSGDFHPWRLPVPFLWRDILQKIKAAHFNTVSIYIHWGMINPAEGVFDWSGPRAIRPFLKMAQEEGFYVIFRPGPYIHAETTAGGLPGWVTALDTPLRNNATRYKQAWVPYIDSVIEQIKPYQYSEGGPIIAIQLENEHEQRVDTEDYLLDLQTRFRDAGITCPTLVNDADPSEDIAKGTWKGNFAKGQGAVDIFGFDLYPLGFECDGNKPWPPLLPKNLHAVHKKISADSPLYVAEVQAGAFDGWGSKTGYEQCRTFTGADFVQVLTHALWAENAKMLNMYLLFGGTNWGHLGCPRVYTSYDYGAAITESRLLTSKYYEMKSLGLFLQSVPSFASTSYIGPVHTSNEAIKITHLRGEDGSNFYVVLHQDTSSTSHDSFSFEMQTSAGAVRVPPEGELTLHGRQATVILSDVVFGRSKLLYSTAPLLYAGAIGNRDIAVFIDALGPRLELRMAGSSRSALAIEGPIDKAVALTLPSANGPDTLVMFVTTETAKTIWSPNIEDADDERNNVLVLGPYLVRKARLGKKGHLELFGDVDSHTLVQVLVPEHFNRISWNGETMAFGESVDFVGGFAFAVPGTPITLRLPQPVRWRYSNAFPEGAFDYDDSHWIEANKTETAAPYKMLEGEKVLFACDYGFCTGSVLYRGRFRTSAGQTCISIGVAGGSGMSWAIWNAWIVHEEGVTSVRTAAVKASLTGNAFSFEVPAHLHDQDLVLVVMVDNMGQDIEDDRETDRVRSPRGIIGYSGPFTSWRIQGFQGGSSGFPDRLRGVFNEGGTYGERAGWHLPGFDDSEWSSGGPFDRIETGAITIFRTSFDLDLPDGLDVPISLRFGEEDGARRCEIYVNGWNMGKFVPNLGPQAVFPIPEGILDHHGTNTLALVVWETDDLILGPRSKFGSLTIETAGIVRGGLGRPPLRNPVWHDRGRV